MTNPILLSKKKYSEEYQCKRKTAEISRGGLGKNEWSLFIGNKQIGKTGTKTEMIKRLKRKC